MHFTNRRRERPADDLSHGWGSNSRWQTNFCRHYLDAGVAFYNVDASLDIGLPKARLDEPGMPPCDVSLDQARELLLHRGFVRTTGVEADWPDDWRLAMHDNGSAWPLEETNLIPFDLALRRVGVAA